MEALIYHILSFAGSGFTPDILSILQGCDTEASRRLLLGGRQFKDRGAVGHSYHSVITLPPCPNPVIPTGKSLLWGVPQPPAQIGGDLPRPAFTLQRPELRKRSFVQAVLECPVCPWEGSGREAASQPLNEQLLERRLNPPLHTRLRVRQTTSEEPRCIHSKEKVKIEMSLLYFSSAFCCALQAACTCDPVSSKVRVCLPKVKNSTCSIPFNSHHF